MKKLWFSLAGIFLVANVARAQTPVVVLSAAATSSAPGSAPVTCLLDANCQGFWAPGSADQGADEGVYVQFDKPQDIDYVEVVTDPSTPLEQNDVQNFRIYLDGKTRDELGIFGATLAPSKSMSFGVLGKDSVPQPFEEKVKSIFLKLDPKDRAKRTPWKISKIFFLKAAPGAAGAPESSSKLPVVLPKLIPAGVTATSILEPVSAYHPANLFDSKYDIAWSTDGKKTSGKGESFALTLQNPQTISGMLLWNGYQRSAEHFQANGRVLELEVQADAQPPQRIKVADQMDAQRIVFNPPMANAKQIKFTIEATAPGRKYPDVLISELRLLDATGGLLLPVVPLPKVTAPANWTALLNRSWSSFLEKPGTSKNEGGLTPACIHNRIRIRDNGTFVVYKWADQGKVDSQEIPFSLTANVLEGNWEPKVNSIRIFGKKYPTTISASEYLQEKGNAVAAAIFQSELAIKRYSEMTPVERQQVLTLLWAAKAGPVLKAQKLIWFSSVPAKPGSGETIAYKGASYADLIKNLDVALTQLNPYYISSTQFTDLVLPTDSLGDCQPMP